MFRRLAAGGIALGLLTCLAGRAQDAAVDKNQRIQWWRDARFGMFIHWGLYAIPAGEWKGQQCRVSANGS